jgi:mRNA interferase RelE/StbE
LVWEIEFSEAGFKNLSSLDKPVAKRIRKFLLERLAELDDPRSIGEALKGASLGDYWKYRVGDYRVIATIEDSAVRILVVRIGNRKDIYRQ